ncbi:hypothetical protein [Persicobacter psychrovividus]|uniref:3-hydroxyacyl-ACP dehydratase n=1 Tax=Persicobacter psychrovividus TaxID=387638 RepID=A0ABN6LL01_9BACT|nr:3-hydroxyacyl-ACP dehydratase [Persicobacter psychrovividus]
MRDLFIYHKIELKEDTLTAQVKVNHEHCIFDGHFPEQSILPGVCTIFLIKNCLNKVLNKQFHLKQIKQVKYTKMIIPQQERELTLALKLVQEEEFLKVRGKVLDQDNIAIKFTAFYN